ncbi:hypothetical protein HELRODRAFT_189957 [Helobdella robusta]|uniref:Peptidase S9 prolyl oligopeptidase catalytic domain-containing protein n=1 Tax=Helobdella robusta TaxID=6412 RepID=T1FRJ1_HELRO|nr:hypothetical protein HELRODRAFT_189957 [Helobdella robusta]ESN90707.1 hypothetical protein HELRODRAFT_189957 [Helobdella robusta]
MSGITVLTLLTMGLLVSNTKSIFEFNDIYDPTFRPKSFNPTWISEEEFYYTNKSNDIVLFNAKNRNVSEVILANKTRPEGVEFLLMAPDPLYYKTHFVYGKDYKKNWRHSYSAIYYIFDKNGNKTYHLPKNDTEGNMRLDFVTWAPKEERWSYVYRNNLYYQAGVDGTVRQITHTDNVKEPFKYNGIPNWLYEEDVLSSRVAQYWSPDAKYLCYATIVDDPNYTQQWPIFKNHSYVYEDWVKITYPKAGFKDHAGKVVSTSNVTLHVFFEDPNAKGKIITLKPPKNLIGEYHYYLQVVWKTETEVFVTWTNRKQSIQYDVIYDVAKEGEPKWEVQFEEQTKGWIEVPPARPVFLDGKPGYFTIQPIYNSEKKQTWRHIVHVDPTIAPGDQITDMMPGKQMTVDSVVGIDNKNDILSTNHADNNNNHNANNNTNNNHNNNHNNNNNTNNNHNNNNNHNANDNTKNNQRPATASDVCLTCNNNDCKYFGANFGPNARHYFRNCLGPDVPKYTLVGSNTTQEVSKRFEMGSRTKNWLQHLASKYRIAVASIDGRGTLGQGEELKFKIYKKLGVVEVEDQIKGVSHMMKESEFVDDKKPAAIFGWSYGGHTAAHVLAQNNTHFNCAISIAAVTSKGFYDTAYSERYLGLVTEENGTMAYENTNVVKKAKQFKGKNFFIAHGLADDNVHYTNFAQFIKELEMNDVDFTQITYPDQDHSITDEHLSRHLYRSMTKFLVDDCFQLPSSGGMATLHFSTIMTSLITHYLYNLSMPMNAVYVTSSE